MPKRKKKNAPSYLIMNIITKRPYIDELRRAYAFSSEDAAEEFAEKAGRAYVKRLEGGTTIKDMSDCYAGGADTLVERSGAAETKQSLQEGFLQRRHYNSDLNADKARYIRTKSLEYIRSMRSCRFIVPVKIWNHPEMKVEYATAIIPGMDYKYLAFSDMEEYGKWEKENGGWSPLEVKAEGLGWISRKHGFLLDPCGAPLFLSGGMLQDIAKERGTEDV